MNTPSNFNRLWVPWPTCDLAPRKLSTKQWFGLVQLTACLKYARQACDAGYRAWILGTKSCLANLEDLAMQSLRSSQLPLRSKERRKTVHASECMAVFGTKLCL